MQPIMRWGKIIHFTILSKPATHQDELSKNKIPKFNVPLKASEKRNIVLKSIEWIKIIKSIDKKEDTLIKLCKKIQKKNLQKRKINSIFGSRKSVMSHYSSNSSVYSRSLNHILKRKKKNVKEKSQLGSVLNSIYSKK